MKLLLINYEYPPIGAGAANATYYMAKSFVEMGHEVVVLTAGFQEKVGYKNENGVHVYRLSSRRKKISSSGILEMLSYLWHAKKKLPEICSKHQIERAIIFFSIPCGILGPYLFKKLRVPYVISLRGGDVPGMERGISKIHHLITPLRRRVLKYAAAIVANSKGLAKASEAIDPFTVKVIPNGVDADFFFPGERIKNERFTFLFVGRFQEQKNLFVVLDSFNSAFNGKSVVMKLVGDGPLKNQLVQHAERLEIQNQIEFLPWQSKEGLRNLYRNSDVLINYSLYEGMPNVVLEAMACGLPVIASKIMGHEELIIDGESGFLVDLAKTNKLTDKLDFMLEKNESLNEFGKVARSFVENNFSWVKVALQYVKYLN